MNVLTVDPSSHTPIYLQVMDQVRAGVREGTLAPGTPLPSVRHLASSLEVNPNTVAKAYMLLEKEGIIRSVRRRGTFIADQAATRAQEAAGERLGQTLDRVLEEMDQLGLDRDAFLEALKQKLRDKGRQADSSGGGSQ